MKPLNKILYLLSLTAILVTIERFSFTTKIILQPDSFLRLHEFVQILFLISSSVILPFFILRVVSNNFEYLKTRTGMFLASLFLFGMYLYATGNGIHEVASFLFNNYCPHYNFKTAICKSMFFNDYYFGNILYFIGLLLTNITLILLEIKHPDSTYTKKDLIHTWINSLVYALGIFAYAAFDRVSVGFIFAISGLIVTVALLLTSKTKYTYLPFTLYCVVAYTLGTLSTLLFRH